MEMCIRDSVETKDQIAATATISAADPEVGEKIAEALDKVGQDGVVTVEDNNRFGLDLDFTEGMRFDKGYIAPYFVTNAEDQTAVLEDPYILLTSGKLSSQQDVVHIAELVMKTGKPLLIIAEDVDGEALPTLILNNIRGTFKSCAVKAPGFGDRRKAMLQDMAILTGAQVVSDELGLKDVYKRQPYGSACLPASRKSPDNRCPSSCRYRLGTRRLRGCCWLCQAVWTPVRSRRSTEKRYVTSN